MKRNFQNKSAIIAFFLIAGLFITISVFSDDFTRSDFPENQNGNVIKKEQIAPAGGADSRSNDNNTRLRYSLGHSSIRIMQNQNADRIYSGFHTPSFPHRLSGIMVY